MEQKGILYRKTLPDKAFDSLWDRIIMPPGEKESIVNQIILEYTIRARVSQGALPMHGLILLAGPPGTGKTTLAKAAASKAAAILRPKGIQFVEVEPHSLTSSSLGKTQRAVHDLLQSTIREVATQHRTIVLLDEAETLAANRYRLSLEANPIDVHRATEALLASLDQIAVDLRQLIFIATTNFETALDPGFSSRADFIHRTQLPSEAACEAILRDTLVALGAEWPELETLAADDDLKTAANKAVGLDPRRIRKAVLQACALSKDTALNPGKLKFEDLLKSLTIAKGGSE